MLPQANATLTAVTAPAGSEDFGLAATPGPAKWTGSVGVYLRQREQRVETAGASSIVISRALIVPPALPVAWAEGDSLAFTVAGQPATATVRGIERFAHPSAPGEVRLVLEDA